MKKASKKSNPSRWMDTLRFIVKNPGCTQDDVLLSVYRSVKDSNYGRQSPASAAIARLRRKGLVEDDCERCPHCGRAARGRRNVELNATEEGVKLVRTMAKKGSAK